MAAEYALVVDGASKAFLAGGGRPTLRLLPGRTRKAPRRVLAVDNVSLRIQKREIYGILGTNGSGKSTLIRLVSTLLLPDSGTVTVFGRDVVRQEQEVKRMINRVSVEASFFKKLSSMENLLYAARLYGLDARTARAEIARILGLLGIPRSRIGRPVEQMSRGMQQKVAIARAFLTSPILLLLDEPTTGLDPRSKLDVQRFVLTLREEHDATIVLTSHDMGEADALCDRLAIIDRGKVLHEGTPLRLKQELAARGGRADLPSLEEVFLALTGRALEEDSEEEEGSG
jgi:ABC-2 type transport system ATP-binding protein